MLLTSSELHVIRLDLMDVFEAMSPPPIPAPRPDPGQLRRLLTLLTGDEKHGPATLSTLDVLWVLHARVLRIDPASPGDPDRDRFVLSKGHGPAAYYAVLAACGFLDEALLPTFGQWESPLGWHPDRLRIPGVEVSSGSLGHGLAIAVGIALSLRAQRHHEPRVVCLLGDGECEEGSVHEAAALAGRERVGSLTAVVVDNHSTSLGWPGGIGSRFSVEGWETCTVDGCDRAALEAALSVRREGDPRGGTPRLVVADIGTAVPERGAA